MNLKSYLEDNNAQKQISKLAKKCKNKKVVFYGAGDFFYTIKDNYDLSGLNVVGISDLKFNTNKSENKTEYRALAPDELKTEDYDAIVITLLNDLQILKVLENQILKGTKNENVDIYPIITPTIKYLISKLFERSKTI